MTPCIAQVTTLAGSFADDVKDYAAGGCTAVEVWLTKLEQHLEAVSADDTRHALADRGITLAAAAYQGGLLVSQGEQRKAHFDHFKRRHALCERFQIPTLLLAADFATSADPQAFGRAVASLTQAAQWAGGLRGCGLRSSSAARTPSAHASTPPSRWSSSAASRTPACAWTCSTTTRGRASRKTSRASPRATCSTCRCATWPACRAS